MWQIKKADVLDSSGSTDVAKKAAEVYAADTDYIDLKVELHRRLLDLINLSALEKMSRQQIETEIGELVHEQLAQQKHALNHEERKQLVSDILDELLGLGPLEPLLEDNTITDILVNGPEVVFVERKGVLERVETRFKDERHLLICPLQSGPKSMLFWTQKGMKNAIQETHAGRDYRQIA